MAQVHGKAGAATYHKGDRLMYWALVPMVMMGILIYLLFRSGVQTAGFLGAGVACVVVALGFWCVRDVFSLEAAADQYYGGAGGEYDVGVVLSRLPHEFHVFNGLGFYAGDVDHIIVGPTGVFVVETKNHSGTISLRGGRLCRNGELLNHDFVRQAHIGSDVREGTAETTGSVPCSASGRLCQGEGPRSNGSRGRAGCCSFLSHRRHRRSGTISVTRGYSKIYRAP